MVGENCRGGGEGAGGIWAGEKPNFPVITHPGAWWGAQVLKLPQSDDV